jgi:lipid-A-disaccharide synthase-like uncharacterized protein
VKYLRARPWMVSILGAVVVCVGGLLNTSNKPLAVVLYGLGLVSSVSLGVIIELSYRRKLREQQR